MIVIYGLIVDSHIILIPYVFTKTQGKDFKFPPNCAPPQEAKSLKMDEFLSFLGGLGIEFAIIPGWEKGSTIVIQLYHTAI